MANELVTTTEAENIHDAAQEDLSYKLLKFKKGDYFIGEETVPLGTEYIAQPIAWTKVWIKFKDGKVVERKLYRAALKEKPVDREDLDEWEDRSGWELGLDDKPQDPWVKQYLLPLENAETGELVVFTTSSVFGRIAVAELCDGWAKQRGKRGVPVIEIQCGTKKSKYGKVACPVFQVVRWEGDLQELPSTVADEMNDEIPL